MPCVLDAAPHMVGSVYIVCDAFVGQWVQRQPGWEAAVEWIILLYHMSKILRGKGFTHDFNYLAYFQHHMLQQCTISSAVVASRSVVP